MLEIFPKASRPKGTGPVPYFTENPRQGGIPQLLASRSQWYEVSTSIFRYLTVLRQIVVCGEPDSLYDEIYCIVIEVDDAQPRRRRGLGL